MTLRIHECVASDHSFKPECTVSGVSEVQVEIRYVEHSPVNHANLAHQ